MPRTARGPVTDQAPARSVLAEAVQSLAFVVAEELLAVVASEQEGEVRQVGAQGGEVVAVGADEAAEGGGQLRVVRSGEPLAD
jgi:hypothetical protein